MTVSACVTVRSVPCAHVISVMDWRDIESAGCEGDVSRNLPGYSGEQLLTPELSRDDAYHAMAAVILRPEEHMASGDR